MRVLIADDDPLVCQSLKTILQADGSIEVMGIASDGIEAVELFNCSQNFSRTWYSWISACRK